jgi:hypothetical protein
MRFSVDLDFDLLAPSGVERLDEAKEDHVFDRIKE